MKLSRISLVLPLALMSAVCTETIAATKNPGPTLSFDRKGRLVHVITTDGRRCAFHYAPDGRLIPPSDPSCGEPQDWVKAKRGG